MSARPEDLQLPDAELGEAVTRPFPNSRKTYVSGSRPDLRVPMREIRQGPTPTSDGDLPNPPIYVYDTSGPYTDPAATIDLKAGLPGVRDGWIADRAVGRRRPRGRP